MGSGSQCMRKSESRLSKGLLSTDTLCTLQTLHFMEASRSASRDFLRLALFGCNTPLLAALSKAAVTARHAAMVSSFFAPVSSVRNFFSNVLRRDLML